MKAMWLADVVRYCRCQPAFKKGSVKLEVAVRYSPGVKEGHILEAWHAIRHVIRAEKLGQQKPGVAPRSGTERRLVKLMTRMGILKGGQERKE